MSIPLAPSVPSPPTMASAARADGDFSAAAGSTSKPSAAVDEDEERAVQAAAKLFSLASERRREKAQLLAVGLSLKKKDAERMCFIHAATLLLAHGVDIRKERDLLALSRRGASTGAPARPNALSSSKTVTPPIASGTTAAGVKVGDTGDVDPITSITGSTLGRVNNAVNTSASSRASGVHSAG
jgi:hypothetical protein